MSVFLPSELAGDLEASDSRTSFQAGVGSAALGFSEEIALASTEADTGVVVTITMSIGTETWRAGSNALYLPTTNAGGFTFVLNSVSPPVTYNGSVYYAFSGTIDAVMRTPNDTSVIKLHATF